MSDSKTRRKRMSRNKDEWLNYLNSIKFEFIEIISVGDHNIAMCKCQCGKQFTKQASKLRECSNCGCMKNFVNSRAQKEYFSNPDNRIKASKAACLHYKNHPETKLKISHAVKQWCTDHKDERLVIGQKYSQWCKDNQCLRKEINQKISDWQTNNKDTMDEIDSHKRTEATQKRRAIIESNTNSDSYHDILNLLHISFHTRFIDGEITSKHKVLTKCPVCNNYDLHYFRDVFKYDSFEITTKPLCNRCYNNLTSSHYEQEICDYVSTFYSGECIRNSRSVINPLELDLYYPEKKIAIEFNGDYWHNEDHKDKDYHLNKFLSCKEKGITLVSVFESEWNKRSDDIKSYIRNLFDGKEHSLSFNEDHSKMNNNYPSPNINCSDTIETSYYESDSGIVYTCGHTIF